MMACNLKFKYYFDFFQNADQYDRVMQILYFKTRKIWLLIQIYI